MAMPIPLQKARALFLHAVGLLPPEQWDRYIAEACGEDGDLAQQVRHFLQVHREAGSFLEEPVASFVDSHDEAVRERPGTLVGPYKLMEQIGEGGMGLVFVAEQQQPVRRRVALKVIKPGMDTRQVVARFEAERQALAMMDHPNIAKVLDAGTTETGRPYFVMDLVKGLPITEYCDQARLAPRERLGLFAAVCHAVQHAHQKGIIHRDLKPSNVLVTVQDGEPLVKVIDFGIAKALGQQLTDKTVYTGFAQIVGTPMYMSPEQAALSNVDVDTRSDVYSLGVLLYELLTGTTPFDGERLRTVGYDEIRRIIREEEPPKPSTRVSTLGQAATTASANRKTPPKELSRLMRGELDWIVMKCLEKDRNRRYETPNGLAMDLQHYLADEPVQACPPSAGYRLQKFTRRHKGKLLTAAIMLALLVAGTAVSTWQAVRATHAEWDKGRALAAATAAEAQARDALDTLTDDVVETMFTRQPDLGDSEKAFLRKVIGFYETFTQQSGEAAEARFLRAKGYYRVAHLRALLGEHRDAAAGFRQSEALLEQLAAEAPATIEYRHKLARTEGNMAIELAKQGKEGEAETALRRGIDLRTRLVEEVPGESRYRLELANNYNDLGFLREIQMNFPEAERNYRAALDLKEKLVAESGDVPRHHLELARSLVTMGQLLRKQEKYAESERFCQRALEIQQEHMDKVTATPRERQSLANIHTAVGIALAELHREEEAEKAIRAGLDVRRKLVADFPRVLDYRRELANGVNDLGYLLSRQGKDSDTEAPYREALELRKEIVAQAGPVPGYRKELATSYHNLAWVLGTTHRPEEAQTLWRDGQAVWQQLVADLPRVLDFHDGLAGTLTNLARLQDQQGDYAAAVALLEQARPHLDIALNGRPKDRQFMQSFREYLVVLAESRLGLADHVGVAAIADELDRFGFGPAKDAYDVAGTLARCVTVAKADTHLTEHRRQELAQDYSDQALKLLRQAVAHGYADAAHIQQDPHLESLRAGDEFRKLLAELEGKNKQ